MAAGDKLWFELGVRDEISQVLERLMTNSQKLANLLSDDASELKNIYKNISDVAGVYDKIYVAQKRIRDLNGTTLSVDEKKGLREMSKELEKVRKEFEGVLKDPERLMAKGEASFDKLRTNIDMMVKDTLRYVDGIEAKDKAEAINAANEERRIDSLKAKYYDLQRQRQDLANAIANAAPGANTSDAVSLLNGISARMGAVTSAQRRGTGMPSSLVGADSEEFFRKVKAEIASLTATTNEYNKTLESNTRIYNQLKKAYLDTQSQQQIAYIRGQRAEYTALGQKLQEVGRLMSAVATDRTGIQNGNGATYTAEKVMEELDAINRRYNETLAQGREQEKLSTGSRQKHAEATEKASQATRNMAQSNQRLMSTFKELEQAGKSTNRMIDQMTSSFGTMFSFYGMKRLVQQVVTIGGQFEFQHVALQNILGDIQEANTLFTQLQELAVESPKTFMELTSYAKQLSAYQIPASELYDTTKRLADMSTGLGVDMGRLILAYGQVRSAAVLRGQELRQFTEAGIPLVQKLADKFTEMNGKLTTTADVFALISKRKVPFEMVQQVLWDMTNQGGQFYNMQAELADTLYGKWQKLQDTWQIMLGHIADGNSTMGAFMRTMLEGVVSLTRSLDTLMPMLAMLGAGRMMRSGKNMFLNTYDKYASKTDEGAVAQMRLAKEKEANRLMRERYQMGRMITAQEWELIRTKNQVTLNDKLQLSYEGRISDKMLAEAMAEERLLYFTMQHDLLMKGYTREQAKQAVLDKERNVLMSYRLLLMKGYTKEQIKQMRYGDVSMLQGSATMAGMMFGKLKTGFMNLIGGWPGIIMTAIGAVMSIISHFEQKAEELAQKGDAMMNHAQQNANNLKKTLNATDTETSMEKKIEALEDSLINVGRTGEAIVAKSREHMDDINKRWEILKAGAEDYQKTLVSMGNPEGKALFESAIDDSDIEENLRKYDAAVNDVFKQYAKMNRFSEVYKEFIAMFTNGNEKLAKELEGKDLFAQIDTIGTDKLIKKIEEKISTLKKNSTERVYLLQANASLQMHLNLLDDVNERWEKIAKKSIPAMKDELEAAAKKRGIESFDALTDEQKQSLETLTREYVNSIAEGSVEAKNKLAQELASQVFKITIEADLSIDKTKLSGFANYVWTRFGGIVAGDNGKVNIGQESFTKQQVANIFGNIGQFAKEYNSEWKSQTEEAAKLRKAGAEQLAKDMEKDAEKTKSVLDALGLFDDGKKGKGKGSGSKKDTELESWKNRITMLEKYRKELEELEKLMTRSEAESRLRKEGEFNALWGYFKNPNDYKASIDEAISELNIKGGVDRQKYINELNAKKSAENMREYKDSVKDAVSELSRLLGIMSENYNVYKKWMDLTGDADLAARIAGVTQNTTYADYLKDTLNNVLKKTNLALTAEDVFGLKEGEAKKLGKDNEIFKLWEEWQKNQQKIKKDQLDLYEDAIKNSKSYEDKIEDVNRKLKEQIEAYEKLARTDEERARLKKNAIDNANKEISKINWEKFKEENNWGEVFGDLENLPLERLKKMINAMREYAKTANMDVVETKAWYEAMNKLVNQEAIIDPINSIKDALKNYNDARINTGTLELKIEGVRRGYYKDEYDSEEELQRAIRESQAEETKALVNLQKAIKSLANNITKLGNSFEQLGNSVGGTFGDVMNGFGAIFGGFGKSFDAISSVNVNAKGIAGLAGKVSAVVTVFSAMIDMNAKLHELLPSTESLYEHYAKKQREINEAREAIDDYAIAVIKRAQAERDWLYKSGLTELRNGGYIQGKLLENYTNTAVAEQAIYEEARAGISKWAGAIIGAIVGAVITIVTWGSGGPLGVAAGTAIANVIGGVAATAVGAAVATGAGAALGQAMQSAVESVVYREGYTSARQNMRVQTRHSTFFRSEKTQNLEDWVRDNYGKELFGKDFHGYKLLDVDLAKAVLESNATLVGETRETLERFLEITEQIEEIQDQVHEYVSQQFSPLVDNMTDSLWAWLSDGKDMMDSFYDYASDTFADIAKEAVKAFLKINLMDKFTQPLNDIYEAYSFGLIDEGVMMLGVANIAGQIGTTFEQLAPTLQHLGEVLNDAFSAYGYDITGNSSRSSSTSSTIKGVTEQTADLLASHVNAIRADVSVNRETLMQILYVVQMQAEMPVIARAQLVQLQTIASNTGRNVELVGYICDLLHKIAPDGTAWKIK